jgi:TrmH family RNA methyltransferase
MIRAWTGGVTTGPGAWPGGLGRDTTDSSSSTGAAEGMPETITSAANPVVRRVRLLADRRRRRREGAFFVDGIQPVWRAVCAGWDIETLIAAPGLLSGAPADMVTEQEERGIRVARLSSELFRRISDRDGPAGLAAIVRSQTTPLEALHVAAGSVFTALHEVRNPGNLGTIIRTADATGTSGVILIGDCADPFAPAAVRASMGSLFGVAVTIVPGAADFFRWADGAGIQVVATSGSAEQDCWSARYRLPLTILLGTEGSGLPADVLDQAGLAVRIPMTGTAESLNLAVAAGIMLYELQRRRAGGHGLDYDTTA